jgi:KDO2-lipid IV(A) lauroyltransferase
VAPVRRHLESAAVGAMTALAGVLPRTAMLGIGSAVGRLSYAIDARHRRITLDNLRLAYRDELPERELRRIARGSWAHFARIGIDTLNFGRFSADAIGRVVHYQGLEHIRAAYDRGRGVLLFSGHYGHWELIALMQGHLGLPLVLVTRPLDNPMLEARLGKLRGASGNVIIHRRGAVREMLKALRRGLGVAIVIDQDARRRGIFVPFFGRPSSTTPTLASLALKTGAAVVPVFSVPRRDGSYDVTYEPEVVIEDTGDPEADVRRITAHCTAIIERWVRLHPEIWLWMHRRWKTAPKTAPARG